MATPVRSRRRPLKAKAGHAVEKVRASRSVTTGLLLLATGRTAKIAFTVIGTVGLTALAVALVGPKRLEKEVFKPLVRAVEPQAEKLWADARPLREQIAGLFQAASPAGRDKLVKSFQSWVGHFHAT